MHLIQLPKSKSPHSLVVPTLFKGWKSKVFFNDPSQLLNSPYKIKINHVAYFYHTMVHNEYFHCKKKKRIDNNKESSNPSKIKIKQSKHQSRKFIHSFLASGAHNGIIYTWKAFPSSHSSVLLPIVQVTYFLGEASFLGWIYWFLQLFSASDPVSWYLCIFWFPSQLRIPTHSLKQWPSRLSLLGDDS